MFSNMKITNKLDIRHVVVIVVLLVMLYWLLMSGPSTYSPSEPVSSTKANTVIDKHAVEVRQLKKEIARLLERESTLKSDFEKERDEVQIELEEAKKEVSNLRRELQQKEKNGVDSMQGIDKKIKEISAISDTLEQENNMLKAKFATYGSKNISTKPFRGLKMVHFDLKGAPPKIDYLVKVMEISKAYGANGFMIEYEDMFPWSGEFKDLAQENAYSKDDIKHLLETAKAENMAVIPLIQTFGHLEFVLKHEKFSHLRANKEISNSVSALNNGSVEFIKRLIDQILDLHPDSKWIHLGGDEVWNMRTCDMCLQSNMSDAELFTHHMVPLCQYVKTKESTAGVTVQPIIWDDMMRRWNVKDLMQMSDYVSPMVWAYVENLDNYSHFPTDVWKRYSKAFPEIWLASSFKGALKPWTNFVPIKQHLENHLSWLKITTQLQNNGVKVTGIALTGWSRFDHYGPLCELLPAGVPCLALCLTVLSSGQYNEDIHTNVSKRLGFEETFKIDITSFKAYKPESAKFPGADVYTLAGDLEKAIGWKDWSLVRDIGWTRPFHMKHKHASFYALNTTITGLNKSNMLLRVVKEKAHDILKYYFDDSVVDEWIEDKVEHYIKANNISIQKVRKIMNKLKFD